MQITQRKEVKAKIGENKLRSNVNWQGALQQVGAKQTGVKQGMY
jgi:hypothetical protein